MMFRANTQSVRPKQTNLIILNPCLCSQFFLHLPCSPSSLVYQQAQLQRGREMSLCVGWRGHLGGPFGSLPLQTTLLLPRIAPWSRGALLLQLSDNALVLWVLLFRKQKSPSSSLRFAFTWRMTSEVSLTQLPHLHIRSASKEHAVLHVDLALAITRNGSSTAAAERHAVCRVHGTQGNLQTHHTARHY